MKKTYVISIIFFVIFNNLFSQEDNLTKIKFSFSYFGETITHSGLNIGIEYYPFQSKKYQMILASNIGGYTHKRNNTSLFIRGQWGQRVNFNCGIFIDEFLGVGYLHHFANGGDIYEVLPNGSVVKSPNRGKPMFMPSVAVGTGYDFGKKTKMNITYFFRPELFWKAPFNGYFLTHVALNTGFIFKINHKK